MSNKISLPRAAGMGLLGWKTIAGRSTRSEFWYFNLFFLLVAALLYVPGVVFLVLEHVILSLIFFVICVIFSLFSYVPLFCVTVRRLHDLDLSAWWLASTALVYLPTICIQFIDEDSFLFFPTMVLSFMFSIGLMGFGTFLMSSRGTIGENRFGPDPLERVLDEKIIDFWWRFFRSIKSVFSSLQGSAVAASTQLKKAASEIANPRAPNDESSSSNADVAKVADSEEPNIILLQRLAKMRSDDLLTEDEYVLAKTKIQTKI